MNVRTFKEELKLAGELMEYRAWLKTISLDELLCEIVDHDLAWKEADYADNGYDAQYHEFHYIEAVCERNERTLAARAKGDK